MLQSTSPLRSHGAPDAAHSLLAVATIFCWTLGLLPSSEVSPSTAHPHSYPRSKFSLPPSPPTSTYVGASKNQPASKTFLGREPLTPANTSCYIIQPEEPRPRESICIRAVRWAQHSLVQDTWGLVSAPCKRGPWSVLSQRQGAPIPKKNHDLCPKAIRNEGSGLRCLVIRAPERLGFSVGDPGVVDV